MAKILGFENATKNGNVITITPGNYGGVFMDRSPYNEKLIIDAKDCTFNGSIYLPEELADIDFVNFSFYSITNNACWQWKNDKVDVGLKNIRFLNCTADNCMIYAMIGSYDDFFNQKSMSNNIHFIDNVITNTLTNNVFTLNKCYGTLLKNNIIKRAGAPDIDDASHQGIIFIRWSDGEFFNNRISEGGGNAFRVWPAGQGKDNRGLVSIHDNYVVNMRKFSAVESNSDADKLIQADVLVKNNTFGNLLTGISNPYASAGVDVYKENNNKRTYFENNVVFNTSTGLVHAGDGSQPTTNLNNFYFNTAENACVDLVSGLLLPESPAYGKAGAWIKQENMPRYIKSVKVDYGDGLIVTVPAV